MATKKKIEGGGDLIPERLAALGSPDEYRLYRKDVENRTAYQIAKEFHKLTLRATLDALEIPYNVEDNELELALLLCGE